MNHEEALRECHTLLEINFSIGRLNPLQTFSSSLSVNGTKYLGHEYKTWYEAMKDAEITIAGHMSEQGISGEIEELGAVLVEIIPGTVQGSSAPHPVPEIEEPDFSEYGAWVEARNTSSI